MFSEGRLSKTSAKPMFCEPMIPKHRKKKQQKPIKTMIFETSGWGGRASSLENHGFFLMVFIDFCEVFGAWVQKTSVLPMFFEGVLRETSGKTNVFPRQACKNIGFQVHLEAGTCRKVEKEVGPGG